MVVPPKRPIVLLHRVDPPRGAALVELKGLLVKEVGGVAQLHVAVHVAREGLRVRVADGALEPHDLGLLRHHVNEHVGGDALVAVGEPLEEVRVDERAHAHGPALVVDLAVGVGDLKLAHVLRDGAHRPVAEKNGGVAVDDGDLGVVDLLDVLREDAVGRGEDGGVALGVAGDEGLAQQQPEQKRHDDRAGHRHEPAEGPRVRGAAGGGNGERGERHGADAAGPGPHLRAAGVEGGMEPPVADGERDHGHHGRHRERAAAPARHSVDEVPEVRSGLGHGGSYRGSGVPR